MVFIGGSVDELEAEKKDGGDPTIDGGVRQNVRVTSTQHSPDELRVHFHDQVADPNEMYTESAESTESPKEAAKFLFGLRVASQNGVASTLASSQCMSTPGPPVESARVQATMHMHTPSQSPIIPPPTRAVGATSLTQMYRRNFAVTNPLAKRTGLVLTLVS